MTNKIKWYLWIVLSHRVTLKLSHLNILEHLEHRSLCFSFVQRFRRHQGFRICQVSTAKWTKELKGNKSCLARRRKTSCKSTKDCHGFQQQGIGKHVGWSCKLQNTWLNYLKHPQTRAKLYIIFHQPRCPWNKGISLPKKLSFGVLGGVFSRYNLLVVQSWEGLVSRSFEVFRGWLRRFSQGIPFERIANTWGYAERCQPPTLTTNWLSICCT